MEIRVNAAKPYTVHVGEGFLSLLPALCVGYERVCWVVDSEVYALYGEGLPHLDAETHFFVLPQGESNKNLSQYGRLLSYLADNRFDRKDLLVALGGGVTGDLTGFAAATYMRGIDWICVPTTLLSMVDSSVGGKTAVDLPEGKNLVGAFWQPAAVVIDPTFLTSLPERERKNGMGEVVKYACLMGGENGRAILAGELPTDRLIAACVGYKADVVQADERDNGVRATLNLGHTLGHAIEQLSAYTIPHGTAVAMGLGVIAEAAYRHGRLPKEDFFAISEALEGLCVPAVPYPLHAMCEAALHDKKVEGKTLRLIDVFGLGDCRIVPLPYDQLEDYLC